MEICSAVNGRLIAGRSGRKRRLRVSPNVVESYCPQSTQEEQR